MKMVADRYGVTYSSDYELYQLINADRKLSWEARIDLAFLKAEFKDDIELDITKCKLDEPLIGIPPMPGCFGRRGQTGPNGGLRSRADQIRIAEQLKARRIAERN